MKAPHMRSILARGPARREPPRAPRSAEQVPHPVALLAQFRFRRRHPAAAEFVDVQTRHNLILAVVAGHGIRIDDARGGALTAVGRESPSCSLPPPPAPGPTT